MRRRPVRSVLLFALAAAAVWPAAAVAEPVSGPHGTIDNQFTTTEPNAPSGFVYDGRYHAAGNPQAYPPYMRKMVFYNPPGLGYDTSVPERCTASDVELAALGAEACPEGSRLGGGDSDNSFMGGPPSTVELDLFNNTNEQIILARSPGLATVARGQIHPDGSVEFRSPTCFPALEPPGCPVDSALQLRSHMSAPPYTRSEGGVVRSWLTTPPTCPSSGYWTSPVRFWWADGSVDTLETRQPCAQPGP